VSRSTSRSRNEFATSVARTSPPQRLIASSSSVFKSQRRAFGFGRFLFGALREQKENIKSMGEDEEHPMSAKLDSEIAVIGTDIGKNSFHVVGHDKREAIKLRQKWSRGQLAGRLANLPPCLIGMEACVGAHHLSRKLTSLGHDARLMPGKDVRLYSRGQKNDCRDAPTNGCTGLPRQCLHIMASGTCDRYHSSAARGSVTGQARGT
jgi:hypothetical protein